MGLRPPNAGKAIPGGQVLPGSASLVLLLLVIVFAALIPLAYVDLFLCWYVAEAIGALWFLQEIRHGGKLFPDFAAWQLIPVLGALIASLQILLGETACGYCTAGSVHFWLGTLLFVPIAFRTVELVRSWDTLVDIGLGALSVLLVFAFLSGILAIYFPLPEGTVHWLPFVYRNHYAAFVVLVLPILLSQLNAASTRRFVTIAGAVCGIAGIASAGSRAGLAFLVIELILFTKLSLRESRAAFKRTGIVLASSCLVAILLSSGVIWRNRLAHPSSLIDGRLEYWGASLRMISEKPVTGWGFQTWPDVYLQFAATDTGLTVNRAHSDWLEWTAEGGVFMAIALGFSLIWSIRKTVHHLWFAGVPLVLLYGVVDYVLRLPLILVTVLLLQTAASGRSTGSGGRCSGWRPERTGPGDYAIRRTGPPTTSTPATATLAGGLSSSAQPPVAQHPDLSNVNLKS